MGGSAIGGALLKDWLCDKTSIPIEICRDYNIPAYADENTFAIAVSYSGETEETLSALIEAAKRRCIITTICSGGHLQAFSEKLGFPNITIPSGFPPRAAIAYTFFPLLVLAKKIGVVKEISEETEEAIKVLEKLSKKNRIQVFLENNEAKKLAVEIYGTIPVIYGSRHFAAVAMRLKCQFNENSKTPSKFETFSELNHNEIVGWEALQDLTKLFSIIILRDHYETPEIRHRIEITKNIVAPKVSKILEIKAIGQHKLTRMLSSMYIGDLASVYLALLKGVDPTPTKTIVHLKREMRKRLNMLNLLEKEISKIT